MGLFLIIGPVFILVRVVYACVFVRSPIPRRSRLSFFLYSFTCCVPVTMVCVYASQCYLFATMCMRVCVSVSMRVLFLLFLRTAGDGSGAGGGGDRSEYGEDGVDRDRASPMRFVQLYTSPSFRNQRSKLVTPSEDWEQSHGDVSKHKFSPLVGFEGWVFGEVLDVFCGSRARLWCCVSGIIRVVVLCVLCATMYFFS